MGNGRDIPIRLLGEETVSPAAGKAGRALDKMGDQAEGAAKDAAKLDREVEDLNRSLYALAAAYAAADNEADRADIFKAIKVDQAKLRKQMNVRKLMGDVGGDGAEGFSIGFAQRIGPLVAKAPIGPGLLGAVAAAVPIVVPAVTSMISLGAAGGAVALGAAISAKDPRVAAGIASLKTELGEQLAESAKPFTPAMLVELDDVRRHFKSLRPDLDAVFAKASTYLDPLEDAAAGFVQNALPGFRKLVDAAEPLVDVLADELPELGEDFAVVMKDVAAAARESKDELRAVLDTTGMIVKTSGGLLPIFTETNGLLELYNAQVEKARDNGARWVEPTKEMPGVFGAVGAAAAAAGVEVRSFFDIVREGTDQSLDARQAQRDFEQAIDSATETIKENGKGLDINTAKGRENEAALDSIRREAYEAADGLLAMGGRQEDANVILERGKQAFINAAIAAGKEKSEAIALANSLFKIPDVNRTIRMNDKPARDAITRVVNAAGAVKDIVRGIYYTTHGDLKLPGGTSMKEHGGPVLAHHAYIVGEKRPEVFVPDKPGKIIPSIDEYTKIHATGRAGGMATAPPVVNNHYTINVHSGVIGSPRELKAWFTRMFEEAGRQQARTVDLYRRVG